MGAEWGDFHGQLDRPIRQAVPEVSAHEGHLPDQGLTHKNQTPARKGARGVWLDAF